MRFLGKKKDRLDPDAVSRQAQASINKTQEQQVRVNALTSYLNWRNGENNFGNDFDVAFQVRGDNG